MIFTAFHETLTRSLSSQQSISAHNASFVCTLRKRERQKGRRRKKTAHIQYYKRHKWQWKGGIQKKKRAGEECGSYTALLSIRVLIKSLRKN